jgi:dolichol-phosphate mannosyltransferase
LIRCSIVIPAFNETQNIQTVLRRIRESVSIDYEIIVVVDSLDDSTIPYVKNISASETRLRLIINELGKGPAHAIRYGIAAAVSDVIVVTMADGSDDARDIEELVLLVERGVDIACASRYMPTGQQIGAPILKALLSRLAGKSLYYLGRVGTRDATNSFKAYNKKFINQVGIQSEHGFEMGIELVSKAHRRGYLIAEVPTIWIERKSGNSSFKFFKWTPKYISWYLFALGIRRRV